MNNLSNIVFIGGGGHSLSCCDILNQNKNFNLIGFIDPNKNAVLSKSGCEWLGPDEYLKDLIYKYKYSLSPVAVFLYFLLAQFLQAMCLHCGFI